MAEAAEALRISVSSLQHLTAARRIGFFRLGKRVYSTPEDLEAFLASRRVEPVQAPEA